MFAPGETPCGPGLESNVYTLSDGSTVQGIRTALGIDFGANPYMRTSANSVYNSLQASLQHKGPGYEFLLGYTFARSFDNASGQTDLTNVINPRLSHGLSNFDVIRNFVASYTVQLLFQRFAGSNPVTSYIAKGWSVSGITTLATGLPITLSESDDRSLPGTNADLPDYTPGNLTGDRCSPH